MIGTILLFRDEGDRPHCEIALANGDRVSLALDARGLAVTQIVAAAPHARLLFRTTPDRVSSICAGMVGPKREADASPLRILAATVQRISSAAEVKAAFEAAVVRL